MSNEHERHELTPAERELEEALRTLQPAAAGIDPLMIAYRAGATRRQQSLWMWRAVAAVFALATGVVVLNSNQTPSADTSRHAPAPAMLVTLEQQRMPSYRQLRQSVLDQGLDALTIPVSSSNANDDSQPSWRPS